ncbi:Gfo/Idh/MocA family oxidoreductase [Candidatus Pelagibacter sp.]|nr:Gfo/Idh/MocA family oxidoreductase [Candidatus Pelagibacter sp.]MDC0438902.1 Gfo/Idh/MocA family oxidoreductase [Candidatus Pelagibacter sp.]MDC0544791.1 Gfo/Idh/MocA family oxidoreductase [Candidatus Pelagibacter sp.]MDC0926080.1 Gfo/Idh/MocA family oxidoreductase [Candidatus Pelagibacter sp.]MDC1040614.1 Gfo/Idh/MocA family oxidoreductase [Candidatus Pelagibacter sp.]
MIKNINLGVIGIDHGHIFDMLDEMLKEGCTCDYFWTEGSPLTLKEFNQKYPNIKRVENKSEILNDNKIDMILISSIPKDRAINSIEALKSGKDVMVDKPGCTTLDQLEDLKRTVKQTGKIWSVNFSERFHVAAVAKAEQLVAEGKIGKVKQTMGTGPHRQGNYERPNWFYERESYGGIITDIGSHQIHQFLVFTNSNKAKITHSIVENTTKKEFPGFQDFGEINLTGNGGHGYIRLDWFTPDALPTWGDGRLFILGDKGFIEIRKYTDLAKSDSGNHLYYANNEEVKHIDCRDVKLPYFGNLINDVLNRTETACSQELTYLTMELAIKAQEIAEKK